MSSGSTPITPKQDLAALLHGYMEIAERMVNPHRIWEPCCGKGAIVNTLRTHGHKVIIRFARPRRIDRATGLLRARLFVGAQDTNGHRVHPNNAIAPRLFGIRAPRAAPRYNGQLVRVLIFKRRLPMMHRGRLDWAARVLGQLLRLVCLAARVESRG
jgi:hypothetical protein